MSRLGAPPKLPGRLFKIATTELFAYDPETKQFSPLVAKKDVCSSKTFRSVCPN
ncbi:MAG: hypothetical protein P4N60_23720 [Verrucomicrobiae bacterium]|nr:hypothetical protein [Verrucomicrobiae bacterium]